MADSTQINPTISRGIKAQLVAFCKERGHSQGDVVEAALAAYFAPTDGDAQALMLHKLNGLEHSMKDVVTLLGTVIQHLERQTKPPPPKIATRAELYPALQPAVVDVPPAAEEAPVPPTRSSWRALFGRRATP